LGGYGADELALDVSFGRLAEPVQRAAVGRASPGLSAPSFDSSTVSTAAAVLEADGGSPL
jgi:hypothetical protein